MDLNGDSSANSRGHPPKRKHAPSPSQTRPAKHMREDNNDDIYLDESIADMLPPSGSTAATFDALTELSVGMEQERLLAPVAVVPDSAEWQRTIESVVRNVVSIRFCQTCSFDTDSAITSEATGFVVDAEKGYILTNRHVVCAGPFWGYCVFDNHEEVSFFDTFSGDVPVANF